MWDYLFSLTIIDVGKERVGGMFRRSRSWLLDTSVAHHARYRLDDSKTLEDKTK